MGDGRYDPDTLSEAIRQRAKRALLADLRRVAEAEGVSLNAVLLGALAATGLLPVPRAAFEAAIRDGGIAVALNLRGFDIGFSWRFEEIVTAAEPTARRPSPPGAAPLEARIASDFPAVAHEILREGVRRLAGYQDAAYASLYLDRLGPVRDAESMAGGDGALTRETGRHLALRMSYEDVIRVAQLKCAPDRYRRIRDEVGARANEPVAVLDYFKPGIEELCAVLPAGFSRSLLAMADRGGWRGKAYLGLRLRTTTVGGFLLLRLVAGLRRWRPRSHGYAEARRGIEAWLSDIVASCGRSPALAMEVAECARLIKGYGETHRRGTHSFARIRGALIAPALAGDLAPARAVDAIASARVAALADPDGVRLEQVLSEASAGALADAAE
jgi:indolepyruvate ferredoxin oxidoreductase beta subunit